MYYEAPLFVCRLGVVMPQKRSAPVHKRLGGPYAGR